MTYVPIRGRSFNTYLPCKAWMIYLINRGIMAPLKEKIAEIKQNVVAFMMLFSPTNISEMIAKAKTMLGWEPEIDLDKGIDATVAWYLENQDWAGGVKL